MINIPRLPWDQFFMMHAHLAATRSTCDRGPTLMLDPPRRGVGSVFVRDCRIIAGGYNGSPPGQPHCSEVGHLLVDGHCVRTLHAEENALIQCALDGISPAGATVFTTASPCFDCSKRLIRAGVAKVIYGEAYGSRYGMSETAQEMLNDAGITVTDLSSTFFFDKVRAAGAVSVAARASAELDLCR